MLNSTLLEILKAISKEDLKRMEDFINSPFYNKRKIIVKLFSYLKKFYPEFNSPKLEKETVWKFLYPAKDYNYGIVKNLIHDITKLAEHYFSVNSFSKNDKLKFSSMLQGFIESDLINIFNYKYKSFESNFKKSELMYPDYYRDYLDVKRKLYLSSLISGNKSHQEEVFHLGELTTLNFIIHFCRLYCNIYALESEYNIKDKNEINKLFTEILFDEKNIDRILNYLNDLSSRDYLYLKMNLSMVIAFRNPDKREKYFEFKKNVFDNLKLLSDEAKRNFLAGLNNSLHNLRDADGINKNDEVFDLVKCLVLENIFEEENGKVQFALFIIAIKIAALSKDPDFLNLIKERYISKLSPDVIENAKVYSTAYFYFAKNEFEKSNDYIGLINFDTFPMKYNIKNLQLMNAFEINDYDYFTFLQDNYKHFLNRNKSVEKDYKEGNMKFIKYIDRLFKLRQTDDKHKKEFLRKEIENDDGFNKYWILDKIDELKIKN